MAGVNIPSIAICDDWPHVINVWCCFPLIRGQFSSRIPLFAIMHLLGFEETLDLVGDCVVWVIAEVGGHLVGASQEGRASPARDVEDFLVWCLLRHLYWVDSSH
jgi:hypothetical protein